MKLIAIAVISAVTGASAQLSKRPLRSGAKDLAEDEAVDKARVLQESMSMMVQEGIAEYIWNGKWPAPETTTEATEASWEGTSKASKSKGSKDWWSDSNCPAPDTCKDCLDAECPLSNCTAPDTCKDCLDAECPLSGTCVPNFCVPCTPSPPPICPVSCRKCKTLSFFLSSYISTKFSYDIPNSQGSTFLTLRENLVDRSTLVISVSSTSIKTARLITGHSIYLPITWRLKM